MNRTCEDISYDVLYSQKVSNLIGHLSLEQQGEVTEQAVTLLGTNLTDKTYLEELERLVSN